MQNYDFTDLMSFKIKVGTVSSFKLCEIIASNRYLGIMKNEAIICMEELARRRLLSDDFGYEEHIKEIFDKFPKFKLDVQKLFDASALIRSYSR
jgi:hypothetical protein